MDASNYYSEEGNDGTLSSAGASSCYHVGLSIFGPLETQVALTMRSYFTMSLRSQMPHCSHHAL
jgi:hypothetical protein